MSVDLLNYKIICFKKKLIEFVENITSLKDLQDKMTLLISLYLAGNSFADAQRIADAARVDGLNFVNTISG